MAAGSGSLEGLRERNRLRVVDALLSRGSAGRSELARLTGLSRTTVASVVADLQARGLVVEHVAGAESPRGGRGRPPVLLRLDPSAGAALGVDFGHRHLRVAVADLSCTVLAERWVEVDVDHAAGGALDAAVGLVADVLAEAGVDRSQVVGAGMGLPGPIDRRTGEVGSSVILPGWAGLKAADELAARLDLEVDVDNDANLGALAEVSFGAGRGLRDVVYVKVASGIGAGIVLGDRIHRGATGVAGELGHVNAEAGGAVCRCGNRGCLETVASTAAMLGALRPAHGSELDVRGLLDLVATGDLGARRVVNDSGRAIGRGLADLCNHLNPEAIVVGGDLGGAAVEPLLEGIREAIDRYALPGAARAVTIVAGELGERAEVLGALALVTGNRERLSAAGLVAFRSPAGA